MLNEIINIVSSKTTLQAADIPNFKNITTQEFQAEIVFPVEYLQMLNTHSIVRLIKTCISFCCAFFEEI